MLNVLIVETKAPFKTVCCYLRIKAAGFDEIVITDTPLCFLGKSQGIVANISDGHNTVRQHFIFGVLNGIQDLFFGHMALGNHFQNKICKTGAFPDQTFHMRQFKMAMTIDKAGRQDTAESLHVIACITDVGNIFKSAIFRCYKDMLFIQ